ncbi:hypothetical protein [Nocardia sp. NPDC050793]|uniref:hypothetical protein n=1 Tax=Nocardia sp. NPDC050793 TaxID=3155159 RepID=UPI0033F54798
MAQKGAVLEKIGFEYGVDAVAQSGYDGHWWLFRGKWTVKYGNSGVEKGPMLITAEEAWPGLKDTIFENGIDAAVQSGNGGHWWFFKGDQTVKHGMNGIEEGPMPLTAAPAWPGLAGTIFEVGVDAATESGSDGHWWFFKRDQTVKHGMNGLEKGPMLITAAEAWPGLRGTVFEDGVDAATQSGKSGHWWLFRGDQTVKHGNSGIEEGPMPITAQPAWPGLKGI